MVELSPRLQACIEQLCHSGCNSVRDSIRLLEQGGRPPGTRALSTAERAQVLQELKAIMAVYDER